MAAKSAGPKSAIFSISTLHRHQLAIDPSGKSPNSQLKHSCSTPDSATAKKGSEKRKDAPHNLLLASPPAPLARLPYLLATVHPGCCQSRSRCRVYARRPTKRDWTPCRTRSTCRGDTYTSNGRSRDTNDGRKGPTWSPWRNLPVHRKKGCRCTSPSQWGRPYGTHVSHDA